MISVLLCLLFRSLAASVPLGMVPCDRGSLALTPVRSWPQSSLESAADVFKRQLRHTLAESQANSESPW